ncbi:MAG: hypothetical protein WD492_06265 [Alkalispirochaeta sp.]
MKRIIALLGVFLVAGVIGAQDWQLQPTYGDTDLTAGFQPDPFERDVVAGGEMNLSELGYYGYVADAPDFDLRYTSGEYRLTIKVENTDADTLLLINAPDGEWHFNDDSNGLDPAITFSPPQDGLYDIWIGTLSGDYADATLVITERD